MRERERERERESVCVYARTDACVPAYLYEPREVLPVFPVRCPWTLASVMDGEAHWQPSTRRGRREFADVLLRKPCIHKLLFQEKNSISTS